MDTIDRIFLRVMAIFITCVVIGVVYFIHAEIVTPRYENILSGQIIEIKPGEAINPTGYAISEVVGVALAEASVILIQTASETLEVKTGEKLLTDDDLGKIVTIKEKGKILKGKKIRTELILISIKNKKTL